MAVAVAAERITFSSRSANDDDDDKLTSILFHQLLQLPLPLETIELTRA